MLKMSGQLSIRINLVRLLAIEIFKCLNGMNPEYLNELLITHESKYELRNRSRLLQPKFNTGTDTTRLDILVLNYGIYYHLI